MRFLCVWAAIALCACAHAPDPMAVYFANTVLITQPWGETDRLLLSPDHTYVMYGVRFPEGHGVWSAQNGQVCLIPADTPETRGERFCNAWNGARVGDRWAITVGDVTVPMEIGAGRAGKTR